MTSHLKTVGLQPQQRFTSFICKQCGQAIVDAPRRGYISGCAHYPLPEYPGPTLRELRDFTKMEFGPRCPETKLANNCWVYYDLYAAGLMRLTDDEKMLMLFIAEAWRWRRVALA